MSSGTAVFFLRGSLATGRDLERLLWDKVAGYVSGGAEMDRFEPRGDLGVSKREGEKLASACEVLFLDFGVRKILGLNRSSFCKNLPWTSRGWGCRVGDTHARRGDIRGTGDLA